MKRVLEQVVKGVSVLVARSLNLGYSDHLIIEDLKSETSYWRNNGIRWSR